MFFEIRKIEIVDDRYYIEWETIADDGLPLIEGDYFDRNLSENEIVAAIESVKAKRAELNARTKPSKPAVSRASVDEDMVDRIRNKTSTKRTI